MHEAYIYIYIYSRCIHKCCTHSQNFVANVYVVRINKSIQCAARVPRHRANSRDFEARTLILETRGAILTMTVQTTIINAKIGTSTNPPPKNPKSDILQYLEVTDIFEILFFYDLEIPDTPFWPPFLLFFWRALSLSKNSWKCASVVKFRGLTRLKSRRFLIFFHYFVARTVIFEARTVIFEARDTI